MAAFAQSRVQWQGSIVDYDRWPLVGLVLGVGAIGGDIVKSFFKRRMKIAPGGRWIPADQSRSGFTFAIPPGNSAAVADSQGNPHHPANSPRQTKQTVLTRLE